MIVFDRAHFNHMTAGDRALQTEVLALFGAQVEAWRAQLTSGQGWRDAAHTLKGSARGIGLQALADACESAEAASNAECAEKLAHVHKALEEAVAELERFAADAA